ncbi:MAG: 3-oxoacyl-ACP reductase FabG [Halioglobus sp.]|nr:3-oxoacyl-ACP reductase FabG [Halioglobus sp.]
MDKTVLVTGSSRGIGRAIALDLAAAGYPVVLHCRTGLDKAEAVRSEIESGGGSARILQFDIADRAAVAAAIIADMDEHGAYYGVVCNAGLARDNAFPAMSGEDWDAVVHSNLDGFYNVLNPVIMPMIRRRTGGRIVTMASVSGLIGNRGQVNYSAAKAGIIGATKALSIELAKRKITVNCVAPGLIETDMLEDAPVEMITQSIPMLRLGQPEEVAAVVRFLVSDEAGYVTRQVISVNGGLC